MSKKMTVSEFKQFVIAEAKRLYNINLFREERKKLRENMETETSTEQEVYDEIEMRMRPTDSRLPYDEIIDIANEYGMDEESVAQIMFQYVTKREQDKEEELKQTIHYIINQDFGGEAPGFKTFYATFVNYDESTNYVPSQVQQMYDKLTKDPSQLSLDLQEAKKDKKASKKHQDHKWSKSKEPCPVCGSNKNYTGPETGGWKSCANCGTV